MSLIVSGHDFVLDPAVVNNITAVDLPSFSEPTATAAVTTTFEFSEDPSSNEIEVLITISNRFLDNIHFVAGYHRGQNTDRGSA